MVEVQYFKRATYTTNSMSYWFIWSLRSLGSLGILEKLGKLVESVVLVVPEVGFRGLSTLYSKLLKIRGLSTVWFTFHR